MARALSYKDAGVDIDVADATKRDMANALRSSDTRVLNSIGAFASLFDRRFPECELPVVVLTSSREDRDLIASYELGVNSYIVKPVDFAQFTEAVRQLGLFWLLLNEQPKIPRDLPVA